MSFECRGCSARFSPTSGTIFADRKLPWSKLLALIELVEAGSYPAEIARKLRIQRSTAWRVAMKVLLDRSGHSASQGLVQVVKAASARSP